MSSRADAIERVLQVVTLVAVALIVGFLAGMARPRTAATTGEHRPAPPVNEQDGEQVDEQGGETGAGR